MAMTKVMRLFGETSTVEIFERTVLKMLDSQDKSVLRSPIPRLHTVYIDISICTCP